MSFIPEKAARDGGAAARRRGSPVPGMLGARDPRGGGDPGTGAGWAGGLRLGSGQPPAAGPGHVTKFQLVKYM